MMSHPVEKDRIPGHSLPDPLHQGKIHPGKDNNSALKLIEKKSLPFHFTHRGFPFSGQIDLNTGETDLSITADLGLLPYSAQSAFIRICLLEIIHANNLMQYCRFSLGDNNRIFLNGHIHCRGKFRQAILVSLLHLLIDCHPHLTLFRECLHFLPHRQPDGNPSLPGHSASPKASLP